jgi:hypothetical protein
LEPHKVRALSLFFLSEPEKNLPANKKIKVKVAGSYSDRNFSKEFELMHQFEKQR